MHGADRNDLTKSVKLGEDRGVCTNFLSIMAFLYLLHFFIEYLTGK